MRIDTKIMVGLLAASLAGLLLVGCSSADSEDAETSSDEVTEVAEDEATTEVEESEEEGSGDLSDAAATLVAGVTWENPEGSVWRSITFQDGGTAEMVNYAGAESSGTWTLEDDYLKVESDGGESWGSPIEINSDDEFTWANESGTWTTTE